MILGSFSKKKILSVTSTTQVQEAVAVITDVVPAAKPQLAKLWGTKRKGRKGSKDILSKERKKWREINLPTPVIMSILISQPFTTWYGPTLQLKQASISAPQKEHKVHQTVGGFFPPRPPVPSTDLVLRNLYFFKQTSLKTEAKLKESLFIRCYAFRARQPVSYAMFSFFLCLEKANRKTQFYFSSHPFKWGAKVPLSETQPFKPLSKADLVTTPQGREAHQEPQNRALTLSSDWFRKQIWFWPPLALLRKQQCEPQKGHKCSLCFQPIWSS